MISAIHNLTFIVFEHLAITSNMDVDKSIKDTQHIPRVTVLNK